MAAKQPAMSPSDLPVSEVLDRVTGPRRAEADELLALHREVSGAEPVVWAGRILGFGGYEYRYETGTVAAPRSSDSLPARRSTPSISPRTSRRAGRTCWLNSARIRPARYACI